jgi:hypothetical protein
MYYDGIVDKASADKLRVRAGKTGGLCAWGGALASFC